MDFMRRNEIELTGGPLPAHSPRLWDVRVERRFSRGHVPQM